MESDAGQLPLSHKAWAWFEMNKKPAIGGATLLLVVGVIVAFFFYRQNEEELAASEALSDVIVPQLTAAPGSPETAEAYLKIAATYPKSAAAARAVLLAAGSLFVDGKYSEAKAQFERFKRDYSDSRFLGEALLGIAACLDAQGQTREAMAAYKDVIDRHSGDSNVPHAKFALGRLDQNAE